MSPDGEHQPTPTSSPAPRAPPGDPPDGAGGRPRTAARFGRAACAAARTAGRFLTQLGKELLDDRIDDVGAMMAYYAILALFPMLVFVLTLSMLVVDADTIHQGVSIVTRAMPESTRQMIAGRVQAFIDTAGAGFAVGSAAIALWGASRGTVALANALNLIFDKVETRPWWRRQLLAIGVTLSVAVVVVLALALLVVGPHAGHWLADRFGLGGAFDTAWGIGRWVGAGLLVMIVWAVLYKLLPNTDVPFRIFTPGAFVGVLLWLGISAAFGAYLEHFNRYETTYGALGGGIIFLTWLWLSNIAILFGAEVNDVLADFRRGTSAGARQLADGPRPPDRAAVEPARRTAP